MHILTERDKTIVRELLDARNSGTLSLHDFLQRYYFNKNSKRALIIQVQGQYAVFFLAPTLFDNIDSRNEEIQAFFDMLALLQELKKEGYLITYSVKPEKIYFFQECFSNPKPQQNSIILNEQGDYSSSPDSIHDKTNAILFKGTYFHGDLFGFILNNTTGMMIIHKKMEVLVNEQSESERKSESESKSEEVNNEIKPQTSLLTKINLLLTSCVLVLLVIFFFYHEFKNHTEENINAAHVNDSVVTHASVVSDSSVKTAGSSFLPSAENENKNENNDSAMWRGVDISKWNGNAATEIDPSDSITFIICKATEGVGEIDPDFDSNWQIIKSKNYILGTYHFYRTDDDPVKQAQHFLSTINKKGKTDMVPIVDIEHESIPAGSSVDNSTLQKNLMQFLTFVESQCNCTPMIYTNSGFANEFLVNRIFNKYPLWLAAYTTSPTPPVPYAWRQNGYKIWQKINSYHLETHVYDFDVFYGKKNDLYK